ncbi:pleiotropic drug resistance protein 1 [Lathyrus oleraceus]|uniref:pleiotropic drug resistance protein 1 n=1 Tax=Pisum sativum TaxID=3888 RepID=UPI0021D3E5FB|nr:pleiotropic drug resistance protein 1-like [Pisum sativum]
MPIVGAIALHVSLLTFTLRVHPDRLDYVDLVLGSCVKKLSGKPKLDDSRATKQVVALLSAPLDKYNDVVTALTLSNYPHVMDHLDNVTNKVMALVIIQSIMKNNTYISTADKIDEEDFRNVQGKYKCIKSLIEFSGVSLSTPTPNLWPTYELFDDIILISDGQIVYQGPREHVLDFFEFVGFKCPERKGAADFLQEVTSKKDQEQYWFHREKPYRFVTVTQFAETFQSYHVGRKIGDKLAIPFDKSKNHPAALTTEKYGVNKKELLKANFSREYLLMISYDAEDIKSWWIWGYWISPLMYGQNAIMVNEFLGDSWNHFTPNSNKTLGIQVLESRGFFTDAYWYWIGVGALVGFMFLYNIIFTVALTHLNPFDKAQATINEESEDSTTNGTHQEVELPRIVVMQQVQENPLAADRKEEWFFLSNHIREEWLRLPAEVDYNTRKMFIEEVMELVELNPLRNSLVGLPGVNGLSTEQRKRLTIAVELVANPSIIFMDEPTSGLDARAAAIVMRTVRNTVDTGRTVVCTIHQPSIDIFEAFDELFLMKRGGQEVYVGPLGRHSSQLIKYFESIEGVSKIKDGYNPATWMLEVTSSAQELTLGVDFNDTYKNSELFRRNKQLIEELGKPAYGSKDLHFSTQYSQSFSVQCLACLWKQHWSYWRNPPYTAVRFFFTTFIGLMFGTIFWDLGRKYSNRQDLFNAFGSMYTAVLFLGVQNSSAVQPVGMSCGLDYIWIDSITIWRYKHHDGIRK